MSRRSSRFPWTSSRRPPVPKSNVAAHPTHCLICAQVPALLAEHNAEAAEARKRGRRARALPFATELPTGATYYVLKRRPELADTPAGKIVASEQAASRGPHHAAAFGRSLGEAAPGRRRGGSEEDPRMLQGTNEEAGGAPLRSTSYYVLRTKLLKI